MKNSTFLKHVNLGYDGRSDHRQKNSNLGDSVIRSDKIRNYALVRRSGWCQYSRNCGWFVNRLFLVGKDSDSGWFSVKVPASLETVESALEWMKPAPVKKAEQEKRKVARQGDWFFFQTKRNMKELVINDSSHLPRKTESCFEVYHAKGEHNILILPGHNWKAVQRKAIAATGD
jgi:hypothetical protein